MNRKILFFINPISGTKKKYSLKENIISQTTRHGFDFEIMNTNAEGDYSFLPQKIKKENFTDIVIAGGDGSVNQVASYLINTEVNVGIIPCGSGNGLAFAAGISKNADKALNIIFNGHSMYIDAFYINGQFSCMLSGLGFDAQVAHDFAKRKKRGLINYIKQTTINFFKSKPYPFEIFIGERNIYTEAFFISVANSNQFGNQFTIAPKASLSDGLLDIVVVKKMNKLNMAFSVLWQLKNGNPKTIDAEDIEKGNVLYFQTKRLRIKNSKLAPLHIDGEPKETAQEFNIEIIPKAFRLLC